MPAATLQQQHERRELIARLLDEHEVSNQAELVELLRANGCTATQSSVSRDLKEMGAVKLQDGYSMPERDEARNARALRLVADLVRGMHAAGPNLLVIETAVGAAQRVAVTLDRIGWPEIVGTLSGDDTIFVATSSAAQQRRLLGRLQQNLERTAS